MKQLVPTLSLLALAGFAAAEVVSDDAAKITVTGLFQPRADFGHGSNVSGTGDRSTYAPSEGAIASPDTADLYFRRLRVGIKGTFQQDWIFQATIQADNQGKNTSTAATGNPALGFYDAFIGRKFVVSDMTHTLVAGKQAILANTAAFRGTTTLLPTPRASAALFRYNGTGAGYRFDSPVIRAGFDVQNNAGDDQAGQTQTYGEGLLYAGRIELTGPGAWSAPWQESFAGKPGHGFVVAVDLGVNQRDRTSATASVDTKLYGFEAMFHFDGLTAVADCRQTQTVTTPDTAAVGTNIHARVTGIQAGYAMPLASTGYNIEPAARFQRIDGDLDAVGATNWGADEFGGSGRQFEVGVNVYFAGHKSKIGVQYIRWVGESVTTTIDADSATANIVRVQQQLWF